MSLFQLGFGEIVRKIKRLRLKPQIKAAALEHNKKLQALGRRAVDAGVRIPAGESLMVRLAETEESNRQLADKLDVLAEKQQALEQKREADAARFATLEAEILANKAPLDEELAAEQKNAARIQRESDEVRRMLAQAGQQLQSLEQSLRKPAEPADENFDRRGAEAQVATLQGQIQDGELRLIQLAEAKTVATGEIERLKGEMKPLQASLDQLKADARQAAGSLKQHLEEQRKEVKQVQAEETGLSSQRDEHYQELGRIFVEGGADAPELAMEMESVHETSRALNALQQQYDDSLAISNGMPRRTMLKFTGLMAVAGLAMAGGGYAANQAMQAMNRPLPEAEECSRMTYDSERSPLKAHPGGPYTVRRGEQAVLDGSKSTGTCLKYTWTFSAATGDDVDKPGHSDQGSTEDQDIFRAVDALACPEGTTGNPGARKTGVRAPTNFLCSLRVTLTVTDGKNADSKDVLVKVKPRGPKGWKTQVTKKQKEKFIPASRLVIGQLQFGKNVCALDTTGGHALHAGRSWQGNGYSLSSIDDPDGPFDGWWYIGSSSLKIEREVQLNQDLGKNSALYKENMAAGFKDIEVLRQSVLEHERLHGVLIFETMQRIQKEGNDPAKIIETLSTGEYDKENLILWADTAIGQIEGALYPGQGSEEYIRNHTELKKRLSKKRAFERGGEIQIPDTDGLSRTYPIENFATAGDSAE